MSDQQSSQNTENLEQVNEELTRALELCHSLVEDYRSKLASRLNDNQRSGAANDDHVQNEQSDRA